MTFNASVRRALVGAAVLFVATPAMAQLADMHEQRRERGRICFTDHYHYGSSSGQPSKKAAELTAIKSWSDFVDFEYGGVWTSWARSGSKSVKCSSSTSGWGCDVSSRPCR